MRRTYRISIAAATTLILGLAQGACGSLDVENPNEPDRGRILSDPDGALAVVGGGFRTWLNTNQGMTGVGPLVTMADSYTASWNNFQLRFYSSEPRDGWQNDAASAEREPMEWYWYGSYTALSAANDVAGAIDGGLAINDPATTKMAQAASTLIQGMALADLALHYDQGFYVDQKTDLVALKDFIPRQALRDSALKKFDAAIALAGANTFSFPGGWFGPGHAPYSNVQVGKLANTFAARLIAYFPRTAAENTAADWAKVASYAANGISAGTAPFDFTFQGDGNCPDLTGTRGFCDELKLWSNDITTMRVDTRVSKLLDPATQTHPFPSPVGNPQPNSPDARLGDGTNGTDFRWTSEQIFRPERGLYHRSNIAHIRYEPASFSDPAGTGGGQEEVPVVSRAENDLLWAEGLIRSGGNLTTAAALINRTRVDRGHLAPATDTEGTASLLAKLQYEQEVELMGLGAVPYFNRRRVDGLQPNTPRQMPVPAKELGVLQKEIYSFGGPGRPAASRTRGASGASAAFDAMGRSSAGRMFGGQLRR